MRSNKQSMDIVEKSILGAGAATIIWMIFKSNKAFAASTHKISTRIQPVSEADEAFFSTYTPRQNNTPALSEIDPKEFANPSARIPAMFASYDPDTNDMDIKALNFTPRKMSTLPNEREYSDISILTDPSKTPQEFIDLDPEPSEMIHPNDYRLLQMFDIIPAGFPIRRTQFTKSVDGRNEFLVGYSEPYTDRVSTGQTFQAVKPLWVVSFGKNFNTSSNPPKHIRNLPEFYETALRMLAAEWELSNAGVNGCLPGVGRRLCDMERAALIGLMMRRREIRDLKRKESGTFEDVAYANRGQTWNRGHTYLVGFNGYPGSKNAAHRSTANRRRFEKKTKIQKTFEDYIKHYLWHMPLLAGVGATHFGHPGTLTRVPPFLAKHAPHSSDHKGYANLKTIRVGGTAASTHGATFR